MSWIALLPLLLPFDDRADVIELLEAGRQRDAAEIMTRLLDSEPENKELRSDLVQLEMRIGRYASALAHAEGLGERFDSTRGTALYLLGRYSEAVPFLSADDPTTVLYRHESLLALARFEEADAVLERAEKLLGESDPELRIRRGQSLARKGKFSEAVPQFRKVLENDPISAPALYGLGRALILLEEEEEGLSLLERHRALLPLLDQLDFARQNLALDSSHAPNHAALADVLRALGAFHEPKLDEAEASFAAASKLAESSEVVPIALRHARFIEEVRMDSSRAALVLDEAFAAKPDARLAVRAGDVLLRAGNPREALKRFESAAELRPADQAIAERILSAREAIESEPPK